MTGQFTYRLKTENPHEHTILVVFLASYSDLDSISYAIKSEVEENLVPSVVYIMSTSQNSYLLNEANTDMSLSKEFDALIGNYQDKMKLIEIEVDGRMKNIGINTYLDDEFKNELLIAGAKKIFKDRKGLLTSTPDYHFSKPSKKHSDKFIRISNLLTSGVEVQFLAIGLLPYLKSNIKRIYVDTSSIAYLISCALQLSNIDKDKYPIIESFESYSNFPQSFGFVVDEGSLVFISATTSGGLTKDLIQKTQFCRNNIVTIFYTKLPPDQQGIYSIIDTVGEIYSVDEIECKLCKSGSKVIYIAGEQFLPETPRHERLLIKKIHFQTSREKFFQEFATNNLLKWNCLTNRIASNKEHFYIDVKAFLEDEKASEKFCKKLHNQLNKHFSRDVKTVISIDNHASEALTDKIRNYLDQSEQTKIDWINLDSCSEEDLKDKHSIIVVAGSITSGRKLLTASRKLRGILPSSTIKYIIGISKLPSPEALTQLTNDLKLGGHEVIILRDCPMPRIKDHTQTAWDLEKELFYRYDLRNQFAIYMDMPPSFQNRIDIINHESPDTNELFLPSYTGKKLELRNTFAFWSDIDLQNGNATQSDVYWTIQSVLHDLRLNKTFSGLNNTYHSTIISPVCFDRFNDGIIQAALLRAALPIELNYTVNEEFSRQMTDVLLSIIQNYKNDQGEAALEFLLAICTERLKIERKHLNEVLNLPRDDMSVEMKFLLEVLDRLVILI